MKISGLIPKFRVVPRILDEKLLSSNGALTLRQLTIEDTDAKSETPSTIDQMSGDLKSIFTRKPLLVGRVISVEYDKLPKYLQLVKANEYFRCYVPDPIRNSIIERTIVQDPEQGVKTTLRLIKNNTTHDLLLNSCTEFSLKETPWLCYFIQALAAFIEKGILVVDDNTEIITNLVLEKDTVHEGALMLFKKGQVKQTVEFLKSMLPALQVLDWL